MTQSRVYQTEAIIIKRTKLGEADRILTLITPEYGKIRAVAKGTRRPQSKLGGHVELLTHSRLQLARGRNLDIITQAQTIESFMPLKNDLSLMSCGLYLSELVDAFTAEDIEGTQLFTLFSDTLHLLTQAENKDTLLRYFELQVFNLTGYRPQLQRCANCNTLLEPVSNFFCSSQGGVICPECALSEPEARPLSLNALKVLRLWQNCNYETAAHVNVSSVLSKELEQVLREYIKHILDRQIKSTEWLDRLKY